MRVDDGEGRAGAHKATPIMGIDGRFDASAIHASFAAESTSIPDEISSFVLSMLKAHPDYGRKPDDEDTGDTGGAGDETDAGPDSGSAPADQ